MADREYKIHLKIEGDASGSAPVDAGLKKVEEAAKDAEDALKKVEAQSRRTDEAVSDAGSSAPAAEVDDGGTTIIPGGRGARSWHTPEQAAEMEQLSSDMDRVRKSADDMDVSTMRAAGSARALGGASVALGGAVALAATVLASGAQPELEELSESLADLWTGFARAAAEGTGLTKDIEFLTSVVKDLSGATARESVEEAKLFNAKMDAALARQKAAKEAEAEKEAVDEITRAINRETFAMEQRNRARRLGEIGAEENAKGAKALEEAKFNTEEAELRGKDGLSREERARQEASIARRRLEARQKQEQEEFDRQIKEEDDKVRVANQNVAGAQATREDVAGKLKHYEPGSSEYKNLEGQLEAAEKRLEKVTMEADRQALESEEAKKKLRIQQDWDKSVDEEERRALEAKSNAAIKEAAEEDYQEKVREAEAEQRAAKAKEREAKAKERESRAAAKRAVMGNGGSEEDDEFSAFKYPRNLPGEFNDNSQSGQDALRQTARIRRSIEAGTFNPTAEEKRVILALEQAAAKLADGEASGQERAEFNQALQRLLNVMTQIPPRMAGALRDLKLQLEPRIQQLEASLGELRAGSTK